MIRAILTGVALAVMAALPARVIDIQDVQSAGGLTAWLVEDHSIPFVSVTILFRGGASVDAPGKRGAAGDRLYVPMESLGQLSRYVGGEAPTLSKMGGADWQNTKRKARKAEKKAQKAAQRADEAQQRAGGAPA